MTIESTSKVVTLEVDGSEVPARIWEGETESGVRVHCYVTRIATDDQRPEVHERFRRELAETRAPSAAVQAIPLRMIL